MLLKSLQLTVSNIRGITRVINYESNYKILVQQYSRFAPRRPVAIVNEDELFDVDLENTTPSQPRKIKTLKARKTEPKENEVMKRLQYDSIHEEGDEIFSQIGTSEPVRDKKAKSKTINVQNKKKSQIEETFNDNEEYKHMQRSGPIATKLYENEKLMTSIMMSLKSKKKRKKNEQILLEGVRLMRDAIAAGVVPETIIYSRWEDVNDLQISKDVTKMYKVPYRTIQMWSTLTTSPGVMGVFKKPKPVPVSKKSLPVTIICDNVRDPGNMGTILRAAAGVGCEKLILTKGCVDFWDSKVLRSAAGAHFRIPIYGSQEWSDIKSLLHSDAQVYVADNNASSFGIDARDEENSSSESDDEESDDEKKKRVTKRSRRVNVKITNLPVVPYFAVDYTKNQVVLIIGGETEGISPQSYSLVEQRQGIRVNVPLDNKIDSLNAGMALGIVAFEIKRQFLQVHNKLNQLIQ